MEMGILNSNPVDGNTDVAAGESFVSVNALAQRLGLCRESVYQLLWSGQIPSVKFGRRRLVSASEVQKFIKARMAASGARQ